MAGCEVQLESGVGTKCSGHIVCIGREGHIQNCWGGMCGEAKEVRGDCQAAGVVQILVQFGVVPNQEPRASNAVAWQSAAAGLLRGLSTVWGWAALAKLARS